MPLVSGAHVMIFTRDEDADRAFLRDVLEIPCIDSGGGWLIFKLPPAELGVHGGDRNDLHELYLMCDDIEATVTELEARGAEFSGPPEDLGFGIAASLKLPGAGEMLVYQPRHPEAHSL